MQNDNQAAIKEMLKSFAYLLDEKIKETTKEYEGVVVSPTNDKRKWNVRYNNETHAIRLYGTGLPLPNARVKVHLPQGNQALAWFSTPQNAFTNLYVGKLQTENWILEGSYYYNQIDISNMSVTNTPVVIPQWTSNIVNEEQSWGEVEYIQSFDGYIRFYSSAPTTTEVQVLIYY